MTLDEWKIIEKWNESLLHTIHIKLTLTSDKRSKELEAFYHSFHLLTSNVQFIKSMEYGSKTPLIQIGSNLIYQAVPLGPELTPFLEALRLFSADIPEAEIQ